MFATALDHERALGIDFWDDTCPPVEGIALAVPHPEIPGAKAIDWGARLDRVAQSVDQRVKFPPGWSTSPRVGGELVIHEATVDDLERYAGESDLVVVAAGKGEIARLLRARRRAVAVRPADARARAHLRDRDDAAARVLRRLLQHRPGRGGVLRLPGPDDERALRDHGLRGRARAARWTAGATSRRRPSTSRSRSGSSRRSCPGRRSAVARSSSPTTTASSPGRFAPTSASRSAGCRRGGPCSVWPTP